MPKKSQRGGFDFKGLLSKGLSIAKKVKDSGLISKGLNIASSIAKAVGKDGIADKLSTAHGFADSVGAGRRRKKAYKKKMHNFPTRGPTMRSEVSQMNGANQLYGTGRKGRMHGGAWYDDLWSGVQTVAKTALPIAMEVLPHLMGGRRRGGALALAGRGLNMAGGAHAHNHVMPNHVHHAGVTHRARAPRMIGHGSLGRVSRGHAIQILN